MVKFTPEVKEALSSLLLCWKQPMVGEVLTVRQMCDQAKHVSPKNVSLYYSSRSAVLQNFFFLTEDEISNGYCGFNSGLQFLEEAGSK
jgi:hypothetical protein